MNRDRYIIWSVITNPFVPINHDLVLSHVDGELDFFGINQAGGWLNINFPRLYVCTRMGAGDDRRSKGNLEVGICRRVVKADSTCLSIT